MIRRHNEERHLHWPYRINRDEHRTAPSLCRIQRRQTDRARTISYRSRTVSSKKPSALFIHDVTETRDSNTERAVRNFFANSIDVISEDFDLFSPTATLEKINTLVSKYNIGLLIGNSLGAFYVLAFYSMRKIVINPCMFPSIEIPQVYKKVNEKSISEWKIIESKMYNNIDGEDREYTAGLFSQNDEFFSYKKIFDKKYGRSISISESQYAGANMEAGLQEAADYICLFDTTIDYSKEEFELYRECNAYEQYKKSVNESQPNKSTTPNTVIVFPKNASSINRVHNYGPKIYRMIADTYKLAGGTNDFISYERFLNASDIWEIHIAGKIGR